MDATRRPRRLLAAQAPPTLGHDAKTSAPFAGDRPIDPSLEAFRWARETNLQLLERMTDDEWRIVGTHAERGDFGTEDWLEMYVSHAHDHAAQIPRARARD